MAKKLKLEITPKDLEMKSKEMEVALYDYDDYNEHSLSELLEKYGKDAKIVIRENGDTYESSVGVTIKYQQLETFEEYSHRVTALKNLVEKNLAKVK